MKRTIFGLVTVLLALGLVLAGCAGPADPLANLARKADTGPIFWLGQSDYDAAARIDPYVSARTNASGPKIPSNAHSNDFPGVYFHWDSKQKDGGYLKVEAKVFDEYLGFVLTKKVSNTYWDYPIAIQEGQEPNPQDNCYVFEVPKGKAKKFVGTGKDDTILLDMPDNHNINMVFISDWKPLNKGPSLIFDDPIENEKYIISFEKKVVDSKGAPVAYADWEADAKYFFFHLYDGDDYVATAQPGAGGIVTFEVAKNINYTVKEEIKGSGDYQQIPAITVAPTEQKNTITLISKANAKGLDRVEGKVYEVDPSNKWKMPNESRDIKKQWNETLAKDPAFADITKFKDATWIWDREDSWMWGTSGSEIIHYTTKFWIDNLDDIVPCKEGWTVPIWFACDNAAVLFVNGKMVKYTNYAMKGAVGDDYKFNDLSDEAFDGNAWQHVYYADIFEFLQVGENSVQFLAANSEFVEGETQNNNYSETNNPCGLIFGCEIVMKKDVAGEGEGEFINKLKPKELGKKNDSVTATNPENNPKDFLVGQNGHFVYAVLTREALEAGIVELQLYVGDKFTKVGKAFVKLDGDKLVITTDADAIKEIGAATFASSYNHSDLKHISKDTVEIPCPAEDTFKLYLHLNGVQYYLP